MGRQPHQQRFFPETRGHIRTFDRLPSGQHGQRDDGSGPVLDGDRCRPHGAARFLGAILRRVHQVVDIRLAEGAGEKLHAGDEGRLANAFSVHGGEDERGIRRGNERKRDPTKTKRIGNFGYD